MNPLQIVDDMIHAHEDVRSALNEAQTTLDYCEKEHNDLIHALELVNFNASEGYRLAKQMQENRQRRREAKDTIELLKPLADLMNKNQNFFRELKNVHAQIEQSIGTQHKRSYRVRVRTDLQDKFDRAR